MKRSKYRRAILIGAAFYLGLDVAIASNPSPSPPETPSPVLPTPRPIPTPSPKVPTVTPPPVSTPTPTVPTVTPPPVSTPTPTVPTVSPPPVATPTVSPVPTIPPNPTRPPVNPPPVATPTIPPLHSPVLTKADPQSARAVVRYGQNAVLSLANDRGRFQKVALQPGEVVIVVLTLTPKDYGKRADVQVLDGGAIASDAPKPKDVLPPTPTPNPSPTVNGPIGSDPTPQPSPVTTPPPIPALDDLTDTGQILTVSQAGELIFHFKAGADVGIHRVSVIVGSNQYFLQFWRQDMTAPNNNPRMLRAY
jgi:hypothetical protein